MRCRLKRLYYHLWRMVVLPLVNLNTAIRIEDKVVATLIKDGKVIKRIVGVKMHNKWWDSSNVGLDLIAAILLYGGSAAGACKVVQMAVGSTCSDSSFGILGSWRDIDEHGSPGNAQAKFIETWPAAGVISDICQAALKMNNLGGTGAVISACYNFGTPFTKPNDVSLKIEWTTTLSS